MTRTFLVFGVALILGLSLSAQRGGRGGGAASGPANPFAGNVQAIDEGRAMVAKIFVAREPGPCRKGVGA